MNCPACRTQMTEMAIGDVKIDVCQGGCGGLWFDRWELPKVEQAAQSAGASLLDIDRSAATKTNSSERRHCPRDADIVMTRRFSSIKRSILVDECAKCGGMFLDAGELAGIQSEYGSGADRQKATTAYYDNMISQHLATSDDADRTGVERARRFAHVLRFICPTYYIPGKQSWGAN